MFGLTNDERCWIYNLRPEDTEVPKEWKYFQINEHI